VTFAPGTTVNAGTLAVITATFNITVTGGNGARTVIARAEDANVATPNVVDTAPGTTVSAGVDETRVATLRSTPIWPVSNSRIRSEQDI
jgi:hypothetical protein